MIFLADCRSTSRANRLFVASREVKFIVPLLQSLNFNREALMQYLLLLSVCGRHIVEGIRQWAPGTNCGLRLVRTIHFQRQQIDKIIGVGRAYEQARCRAGHEALFH